MSDIEKGSGTKSHNISGKKERKGIGCGVFFIIVGIGLFAERMGWFPFSTVWLLPAVFIAWGASMIFEALRDRQ